MPQPGFHLPEFFEKNLCYPDSAYQAGVSGIVYTTFRVTARGKCEDPRIVKGIGFGLDQEALRLLRIMPDWRPGQLRGESVPVRVQLAIRFNLPSAEEVRGYEVSNRQGGEERVIPAYQNSYDSLKTLGALKNSLMQNFFSSLPLRNATNTINPNSEYKLLIQGIPNNMDAYAFFPNIAHSEHIPSPYTYIYDRLKASKDEPKLRSFTLPEKADKGYIFIYSRIPDLPYDTLGLYAWLPIDASMSLIQIDPSQIQTLTAAKFRDIFVKLMTETPIDSLPYEIREEKRRQQAGWAAYPPRSPIDYYDFLQSGIRGLVKKIPALRSQQTLSPLFNLDIDSSGHISKVEIKMIADMNADWHQDSLVKKEVEGLIVKLPPFRPARSNKVSIPFQMSHNLIFSLPHTYTGKSLRYKSQETISKKNKKPTDKNLKPAFGFNEIIQDIRTSLTNAGMAYVSHKLYYEYMDIPIRPVTLQYCRNTREAYVILPKRGVFSMLPQVTAYIPEKEAGYLLVLDESPTAIRYAHIPFSSTDKAVRPGRWSLFTRRSGSEIEAVLRNAAR